METVAKCGWVAAAPERSRLQNSSGGRGKASSWQFYYQPKSLTWMGSPRNLNLSFSVPCEPAENSLKHSKQTLLSISGQQKENGLTRKREARLSAYSSQPCSQLQEPVLGGITWCLRSLSSHHALLPPSVPFGFSVSWRATLKYTKQAVRRSCGMPRSRLWEATRALLMWDPG